MVEQFGPAAVEETTQRFEALAMLDEWTSERHEGLIRKSLVVDHLLDLRAVLADQPLLVIEIDQRLASVPGRSVVEPTWWRSVAAELKEEVARAGAPSASASVDS